MSIDPATITFGIDTFGDVTHSPDGTPVAPSQVLRNVVAEGVLADQVGIDHFSLGEHHRPDFAVSAPDMVLSALAPQTERITLGTAVIVLSSDDPIRVIERFGTLDALSGGRAELTVGRGSFTESFPLFGYRLEDYEKLFEEKLDLLATALRSQPFSWSGSIRPKLENQTIYPPLERKLPTWVAVGGSPNSVVRAAKQGLPLKLAIIGGPSERFAPYANLFRQATEQLGTGNLPIAVHSPGHIAKDDATARDQLRSAWLEGRNKIGRERGWPPAGEREYEHEIEHGALYVGSPETVATKIAQTIRTVGLDRFDLKYSNNSLPHEYMMSSIELFGREVIPQVRELLAADSDSEADEAAPQASASADA